ncbi:MAG TPA: sugar ABC transporter permease [Capillimicrobium sp.]|nr:sugar ABC transporter permease [Capillimicrobium sp.]
MLDRIPLGARFLAPLLVLVGLVVAYPLGYSLWLSLTSRTITQRETEFVGLDQYTGLLSDGEFGTAMRNTLVFVVLAVTIELVLGLLLALALQRQERVRNLTRSFLLTPMFVTPIAVGLMFRFLLNQQLGAIPQLLDVFGITIDFFGSSLALITIVFIDVWQWTPFMVLLLLAGLESLPRQPFEAARIDGASTWMTFRRVTLPLLRPVIGIAVLLRALDAFKIFEYVFATTRGGPGDATITAQFEIYRTGFQFFRLAEAAAMAFVLVGIVLLLSIALYRLLMRQEPATR